MGEVFSNYPVWVRKGVLCFRERDAMFGLVSKVLLCVPIEAVLAHMEIIVVVWRYCHIYICTLISASYSLATSNAKLSGAEQQRCGASEWIR